MSYHTEFDRILKSAEERHCDLFKAVKSIVLEVILAQGVNPGSDEVDQFLEDNPQMVSQVSNRILGWLNHRVGIVSEEVVSELASEARRQAGDEGRPLSTGSVGLHRLRRMAATR
jgi:hypothetical protein